MQSHYARHQDLLKLIILECQKEFDNLRLFEATNGLFYTRRGTPVKVGTNGMPDLFGFLGPRIIFIEVKAGKAGIKKGSDQEKFKKMCEKFGLIHIVGRDPKKVCEEIKRWISENLEMR